MSNAVLQAHPSPTTTDYSQRSSLADQLIKMANKAFFMVVEEVERTGSIQSPFMMTIGADGFDVGRMTTDRAVVMLQKMVDQNRRPGVVAFTEGSTLVLAAVDTQGSLFRVEVPFALTGQRFEEPVHAKLTQAFDDRYTNDRAMKHLLPLRGSTGAGGEVTPEADPVPCLPNPADAIMDMVRLSELSELSTPATLDGLEEERHAEASQGLLACWIELSATLDQADAAALERYQKRLHAAKTPLLGLLAAATDYSDTRVGSDEVYRVRVLASLRAAFDFVDDGATAREELISVFREVLQPLDSNSERAIRKVANKLNLAAMLARVVRNVLVVAGIGVVLAMGVIAALVWFIA